jgi:hypothetical protein
LGVPYFCLACPVIQKSTWKFWKIWDEIWSDLALWDVGFGGSYYFNTKLFFSHPPIVHTTKERKKTNFAFNLQPC